MVLADEKFDHPDMREFLYRDRWYVPDPARQEDLEQLREWYAGFPVKASACTECGICLERCPFDVDIMAKLEQYKRQGRSVDRRPDAAVEQTNRTRMMIPAVEPRCITSPMRRTLPIP